MQLIPPGKLPHQITTLNLSKRGLTDVPPEVLSYPNLRKLDLSHNAIKTIPDEIRHLKKLVVLELSYNDLSCMPESVILLPRLRTISIGHNKLNSLPFSISKSPITELIADYNQIDFILPSTLVGLRKLIISHNRINICLVTTTFPSLKYLDIRHNPSFLIAGKDKLPVIKHYYHDTSPKLSLMPEGLQYYSD